VEREYFKSIPSLAINVVDGCNMQCIYCPPHGENLTSCEHLCSIDDVLTLVKIAHEKGVSTVRLTGGEPLLMPKRTKAIMELCREIGIKKVLLNTNGVLIDDCIKWLEPLRDAFKLKISLDSINSNHFKEITRSDFFDRVIRNTLISIHRGFHVEINSVITQHNINNLDELLLFCSSVRIDLKLLTVNDFCGIVNQADVRNKLRNWISKLNELGYSEVDSKRLDGNRGVKMLIFANKNGNTLTILDHINDEHSLTPSRVYSEKCDNCNYYPCSTGMLNLALRADGLLQPCRMTPERGKSISGKSYDEIEEIVSDLLCDFERSYIV